MARLLMTPVHSSFQRLLAFVLVAMLAFAAGGALVAFLNDLGPFKTAARTVKPMPGRATQAMEGWTAPQPATSSVYQPNTQAAPVARSAKTAAYGSWEPPHPATSSVYHPNTPTLAGRQRAVHQGNDSWTPPEPATSSVYQP